jgi:hypothetical protein
VTESSAEGTPVNSCTLMVRASKTHSRLHTKRKES